MLGRHHYRNNAKQKVFSLFLKLRKWLADYCTRRYLATASNTCIDFCCSRQSHLLSSIRKKLLMKWKEALTFVWSLVEAQVCEALVWPPRDKKMVDCWCQPLTLQTVTHHITESRLSASKSNVPVQNSLAATSFVRIAPISLPVAVASINNFRRQIQFAIR